jgi:hypothetical protein
MKVPHILCAMLACFPLASKASATESPERGGSSVAAADLGETGLRLDAERPHFPQNTRPRTGTSIEIYTAAGRAVDRESTRLGSENGGGSRSRDAQEEVSRRPVSLVQQRGVGQVARGNADRLRSLISAQAHGRIAHQSNRRTIGSTRVATEGDRVDRTPRGASPVRWPTRVASTIAARATTSQRVVARGATIGGPHASGLGWVGGPAINRTSHNATVDGSQLHHKF